MRAVRRHCYCPTVGVPKADVAAFLPHLLKASSSERSLDIHHEFLHPHKLGWFNAPLLLQGQGDHVLHVRH